MTEALMDKLEELQVLKVSYTAFNVCRRERGGGGGRNERESG